MIELQSQPIIPGLELSRLFYQQAIRPIVAWRFSGVAYSAGPLGEGPDVLGFDTPQLYHDLSYIQGLFLFVGVFPLFRVGCREVSMLQLEEAHQRHCGPVSVNTGGPVWVTVAGQHRVNTYGPLQPG